MTLDPAGFQVAVASRGSGGIVALNASIVKGPYNKRLLQSR